MKTRTQRIREAFLNMLGHYEWDLWVTITSREPMTTEDAKRRIRYLLAHLNTPERKYFDKYAWLWCFFEKNPYRNGIHVHAIIAGIDSFYCKYLENRLWDEFGQSQVVPIHEGALNYLADKYVAEKTLDDYCPMKINSKLRI